MMRRQELKKMVEDMLWEAGLAGNHDTVEDLAERLANVADVYARKDGRFVELLGWIDKESVPHGSPSKDVVLTVNVSNTPSNRMSLAMLSGAGVSIVGLQSDLEAESAPDLDVDVGGTQGDLEEYCDETQQKIAALQALEKVLPNPQWIEEVRALANYEEWWADKSVGQAPTDAMRQGAYAAAQGLASGENPYKDGELQDAWEAGYMDALEPLDRVRTLFGEPEAQYARLMMLVSGLPELELAHEAEESLAMAELEEEEGAADAASQEEAEEAWPGEGVAYKPVDEMTKQELREELAQWDVPYQADDTKVRLKELVFDERIKAQSQKAEAV